MIEKVNCKLYMMEGFLCILLSGYERENGLCIKLEAYGVLRLSVKIKIKGEMKMAESLYLVKTKLLYEEAEEYLKKIQKSGCILGLESMKNLMAELGNVQEELRVIHVAGTNGKGSVCAMLSSVLTEAGYRVGTYTSPAVFDRREQYRINGEAITEKAFAEIIQTVRTGCGRMLARGMGQPTVFEVETAAAFVYFQQQRCDVVILETGMGGATDATNIIRKPLVSVLTSISMDHMRFLGDTLEKIAEVKAGIIKENVPAVVARRREIQPVIDRVCEEKHAPLAYADAGKAEQVQVIAKADMDSGSKPADTEPYLHFSYGEFKDLILSMTGTYQVENAVCVIEVIQMLNRYYPWMKITKEQLRTGLKNACWEGRFTILRKSPLFVIDGAHNEDAARKLQETLKIGFTNRKIIYIIGVLADKEHEKMLQIMLPLAVRVFTVTPENPRAMDGALLAEEAGRYHKEVTYIPDISEAVKQALEYADTEDAMILAFGSLSYLKEVKAALREL